MGACELALQARVGISGDLVKGRVFQAREHSECKDWW